MTPIERHQAALNHLRKADPHPAIPPLMAILQYHAPYDSYPETTCIICGDFTWPCPDSAVILEAVENA